MQQKTKFKQTEIGLIPEDWVLDTVENQCDIIMGQSPPSEYYTQNTGDLPFLQGIRTFCDLYPCFDTYCSSPKKIAAKGDILLSVRAPVGETNIAPRELCIGRGLASLRMKNQNNHFLLYLLRNFKNNLIAKGTGTVYSSVNKSTISNLRLPFPPLPEQSAIAEILSSLDDKIELNRRMNATLEQIAQAIFKQWFIDFEFPDENGQPYKSSGGEMVESEMGEIPRGWEVKELKNFGNIICGKTPSKKIHDYYEDGTISFIKIPDMRNKIFPIDTEDKLSKKGAEAIYKKKVPANSVCVSCIATVGLVCLTNEEAYTNQQINSIIPVSSVSPYYLYFAMKELYEKLHLWASGGSATLNLNTKQFSGIKIVMPPADVMVKFDDQNDSIFKKILCNSVESKVLSQTRDLLLPKLMSGYIRIQLNGD
ncbi:restriction endonuclease subunit S [Methanohalophilus portucalensis]|nr:restriction endonuclease subunit S [Methanohalophilus portucalensis]